MLFQRKGRSGQLGQSLSEYAPTFPAVIAILIISTSMISYFVKGALASTIDGLNGVSECPNTDESREGPSVANVGPHRVSLMGLTYNAADDVTTVVYKVESLADPSISHWTLGVPQSVALAVEETSEAYEWTASDPTTGVAGIKFDTGYESSGGGGGGGGGGTQPPADGGGKGGGKKSGALPELLVAAKLLPGEFNQTGSVTTYSSSPLGTSREIFLLLAGEYEFQETTVAIKAGTETYFAVITAPVPVSEVTEGCGS